MDSAMGHLCNLRILMASVKNDNFQFKYFVLCFLCSEIDCGHTLERK